MQIAKSPPSPLPNFKGLKKKYKKILRIKYIIEKKTIIIADIKTLDISRNSIFRHRVKRNLKRVRSNLAKSNGII